MTQPIPIDSGSPPSAGLVPLSGPILTYADLVRAMATRRNALGLSMNELEQIAGLQEGYISKLEAEPGSRWHRFMGHVSMPLWLEALNVGIILVELPRSTRRKVAA